jgi:hypothetical protein
MHDRKNKADLRFWDVHCVAAHNAKAPHFNSLFTIEGAEAVIAVSLSFLREIALSVAASRQASGFNMSPSSSTQNLVSLRPPTLRMKSTVTYATSCSTASSVLSASRACCGAGRNDRRNFEFPATEKYTASPLHAANGKRQAEAGAILSARPSLALRRHELNELRLLHIPVVIYYLSITLFPRAGSKHSWAWSSDRGPFACLFRL